MGRRQAREWAMQVLYQVDAGKMDAEEALSHLLEDNELPEPDIQFARDLVRGTLEKIEELDKQIAALSRDWQLDRMAVVDRNILRLAMFEILFKEDIPDSVSVNEAVEIAKKYGGDDSKKFINGILGTVMRKT